MRPNAPRCRPGPRFTLVLAIAASPGCKKDDESRPPDEGSGVIDGVASDVDREIKGAGASWDQAVRDVKGAGEDVGEAVAGDDDDGAE